MPHLRALSAPTTDAFTAYFAQSTAMIDTRVDPCDDFYAYACGGWLQATDIPATESSISSSFSVVKIAADKAIADIIASQQPPGIYELFESCLAQGDLDTGAVAAVLDQMSVVALSDCSSSLVQYAGHLGVPVFLDIGVGPDAKNTSVNLIEVSQGGLTLPSPDYYSNYMAYVDVVAEYISAFAELPEFAVANATAYAQTLLAFEAELAAAFLPAAALLDPWATYTKLSFADVNALYPFVADYLVGVNESLSAAQVNVATPSFFEAQTRVIANADLSTVRKYVGFHIMDSQSQVLGERFRLANAKFQATFFGVAPDTNRSTFCSNVVQTNMGWQLGALYENRVFDATAQAAAESLINQIEAAMVDVLGNESWLDSATRTAALVKVAAIRNAIGGPSTFPVVPFAINPADFFGNLVKFNSWFTSRAVASVGKPVDKSAWAMFAFTVNAYNDLMSNVIVFSAAILQPPFYDPSAFPTVANYGRIGVVMGHELTHGFDDAGRGFDPTGNLVNWWSPEVKATFETKAQCLVNQYAQYPVGSLDGATVLGYVDGNLTLGENIADNGGLKLAYLAYRRAVAAASADDDRTFFTAFAQGWCTKQTDASAKLALSTDPHAPGKWRVNGAVSNADAFAAAFHCPVGAPMHPAAKCAVW
ncbi:endothelin-converting enzyme 1, metalloprotease family M13 [Achlya hypogyna]|uniref:Endothelin-converting enzyme 1, metalloprotease family M13 n=1 Tax=Achlya hypogyna TaxID=1202772 RepID=A0A1V9Z6P0_ACHHY|nr:endothelin-converting enzyme 1, metalloprotease family M13 [Achlya hypogyna]